jgi:hypothetical protein
MMCYVTCCADCCRTLTAAGQPFQTPAYTMPAGHTAQTTPSYIRKHVCHVVMKPTVMMSDQQHEINLLLFLQLKQSPTFGVSAHRFIIIMRQCSWRSHQREELYVGPVIILEGRSTQRNTTSTCDRQDLVTQRSTQ